MNSIELKSEQDLLDWLKQHQAKLTNKVIRLHGGMGAGKTTLVRLYLSLVTLQKEEASSPTFALHHQYQTTHGPLDHIDLYRLEDSETLQEAGFWDILNSAQTIFIEWSDRVPQHLWPQDRAYVDLTLELRPSGRFLSWLSL